jgi:hypothetical protein
MYCLLTAHSDAHHHAIDYADDSVRFRASGLNPQSVVRHAGRIQSCAVEVAESKPRDLRDASFTTKAAQSARHQSIDAKQYCEFLSFHSLNIRSATSMHPPCIRYKSALSHPSYPSLCSGLLPKVRLDSSQERLGVCAHDLSDLLAVLEQEERRHGADAEVLGDVGDFVDVELVEARCGVFV